MTARARKVKSTDGRGDSKTRAQDTIDTRLALILAAERIFAEEGITNTSLRRINQAAGQRNESAIHYHFGSREGVVAAILEMRTAPINEARKELIRQALTRAEGHPLDTRAIARTVAQPLIDHLRDHPEGTYYLRFQCMLWLDRPVWKQFERDTRATGLKLAQDELIRAKPYLPRKLLRQRFGLALQMVTNALARLERMIAEGSEDAAAEALEVEYASLVDAIVAIFDAPPSPDLIVALRNAGAEEPDIPAS